MVKTNLQIASEACSHRLLTYYSAQTAKELIIYAIVRWIGPAGVAPNRITFLI